MNKEYTSGRSYYLPTFKGCVESCNSCSGLGCKSEADKSLESIEESIEKAKFAKYDFVLFPCNFLFSPHYKKILVCAEKAGVKVKIKVNAKSLHTGWVNLLKSLSNQNISFLIVFENYNEDVFLAIKELQENEVPLEYLIVAQRGVAVKPIIDHLGHKNYEKLFFSFPFHLGKKDSFLNTKEVYRKLNWLKKNYPLLKIKPYPGTDNFDPRIREGFNLEPMIHPRIENTLDGHELTFSIVIPTFDFKVYVVNTIRHLFNQNFDPLKFEVIVVDDGSTDGTEEFIREKLGDQLKKYNFKFIYFPRTKKRKMGDGEFRAGIARNLGVKHARGQYVCFLDSDILTDTHFLQNLKEQHKSWDVIQTQRMYLNKDVSGIHTQYSEIDIHKDTFIPEGGYWHNFYADPVPWQERPFPWKYTCTYCLSMKKSAFMEVGWFKKNYHFYGFEDTDLGYRLYKNGYKFHLSDEKVYHLNHSDERSEYRNSDLIRLNLLKKSAKTFFLNHLDRDIYQCLSGMVRPDYSLSSVRRYLSNRKDLELLSD